MPPKSKKSAAASAAKDIADTEDPLQAVLLADSFETRFRPFTKHTPRCLLPLAGTPLLEYTLEFLAHSGVEEVYIYCGANTSTDLIETYIQSSKWQQNTSPFSAVQVLRSVANTIGDAMRDLDKREILSNDFLIVYGDVVSNISIEPALRAHQARRITDKNAIMTMVLHSSPSTLHATAPVSPVFILDPTTNRCLQYEQLSSSKDSEQHNLLLDAETLALGASELEVRHDLTDPGIDICTPDVLALWSDNFDYEEPRRGFLHSVLKDYELNGKTIHAYVEREGYVDRVRDLRAYERVSRDVMGRRTWPMCRDGVWSDEAGARMRGDGSVRESDVRVAKSARVSKRTLLGRGTIVEKGTKVTRSVIGKECKVGEDCTIEDSYIWDGVTIQDGASIRHAIIGDGAIIGSGSKIVEGTLIAQDVHIPPNSSTKPGQRLIANTKADESTEDYDPSSDEDTTAAIYTLLPSSSLKRSTSTSSISTLTSSRSASPQPTHHRSTSVTSTTSAPSDDLSRTTSADGTASSNAEFHKEASASILDALIKSDDPANIQIELQGLRMASNASEHAVRRAVVAGVMGYILQQRASGSKTSIQTIVKRNKDLLERVVDDTSEQVDLLMCVQRELVGKKDAETVLLSTCNALYGGDVVEGEAVVSWWEDERGVQSEGMRAVRGHRDMEKLIDIARNEDEESSEESD